VEIYEKKKGYLPDIRNLSYIYLIFIFPQLRYMPFVLSAERFGISLFYKELDFTKNQLVDLLQKMADEKQEKQLSPYLLIDRTTSRYAMPIKDNIDYTRNISSFRGQKSDFHDKKLFDDIKDMIKGYYKASSEDINFRSSSRKSNRFDIPLYLASSSVRGLSDLYFFLQYVASRDHLLIIDEPESHLDTGNQVLLARLLARMVVAGLKVLITTHSDYLIKEINNLVMLSGLTSREDAMLTHGYSEHDFIQPESIRAYITEKNSLTKCTIDSFGIDMPVFDKTIDKINRTSNDLSSRLREENEDE